MSRFDSLALAVIATVVLLQCQPGRAHGPDTDWLMDRGYRNQVGEHCCSPNRDCNPIPSDDIERTPRGWVYKPTGEVVPDGNVFRSRDPQDRSWRCAGTIYWYGNQREQKTRCLFLGGTS